MDRRNIAREIAVHLSYELSITDMTVEELLDFHLSAENFASLAEEDEVYMEPIKGKQREYICRLVKGVDQHAFELDTYIESLTSYRKAIADRDECALISLLEEGKKRKEEVDG